VPPVSVRSPVVEETAALTVSSVLASSVMTSSVVFAFFLDAVMFHRSASARDYAGSVLILGGVLVTLWAGQRAVAPDGELAGGCVPQQERLEREMAPR